jgi:hypothetical protein
MKLATITLATLSFAAFAAIATGIEPAAVRMPADIGAEAAKPEGIIMAGRRRKCTEDLGYGRTSSWGCG